MSDSDFLKMVADYMENGMLENIISMFRQDESHYAMIAEMISDERIRVRLGTTALVEDLAREKPNSFESVIPDIGELLNSDNPTLRGDAANLLSIISLPSCRPYLEKHKNDENPDVKSIIADALNDLDRLN